MFAFAKTSIFLQQNKMAAANVQSPFPDAEKVTQALVSGNKLASELLRKATALQSKLQMIEQAWWTSIHHLHSQEESKILELNKLAGHSTEVSNRSFYV
jgi:hypothetical protein